MNAVMLLALVVAIVFVGPYFSIQAVNTLFNTGIELNIYTWLSAAWIHVVLSSNTIKNS